MEPGLLPKLVKLFPKPLLKVTSVPAPLVEVVPAKVTPLTVVEMPAEDQRSGVPSMPVVDTSVSPVMVTGVFQVIDDAAGVRSRSWRALIWTLGLGPPGTRSNMSLSWRKL